MVPNRLGEMSPFQNYYPQAKLFGWDVPGNLIFLAPLLYLYNKKDFLNRHYSLETNYSFGGNYPNLEITALEVKNKSE